jgi:hypothetical protein
MGLLDSLRGRNKAPQPYLDGLQALPAAAATLRAGGLKPTGVGSVCVRPVEDGQVGGSEKFELSTDEFGFHWLTRRTTPENVSGLVGDIHQLVADAEAAGFGPSLLCALVTFSDGRNPTVGLIYRFSRGTWYPFAPTGKDQRDNVRELELKGQIGNDLPVESDLTKWAPVWGAPGL